MSPRSSKDTLRQQRHDYCPWHFADATPAEKRKQSGHQKLLAVESGADIGKRCFISPEAAIVGFPANGFRIGDDSFVAAQAYVTGRVHLGKNCSINSFAALRDNVTGGDGIRIGAFACLVGVNHGFSDTEVPIFQQPHVSKGIVMGDDIWIGSHVTVLDGVRIGSHSILAAGAVVTRDVPEFAIVGGNPARVIRMRKKPRPPAGSIEAKLERFGRMVEADLDPLIRRYRARAKGGEFCYLDKPKEPKRIRPWCDAVEIFAMFGRVPPGHTRAEWITHLRGFQSRTTGLVGEHLEEDRHLDPSPPANPVEERRYNTMIVNYALECLGSNLPWPVKNASEITERKLLGHLASLPWENGAWWAGDWIDCYASSLMPNQKYFDQTTRIETLLRWLDRHCDPVTGLWGRWTAESRWQQPVNGFYRLTRGTYAQYGRPLPLPEKSIGTILLHSRDRAFFAKGVADACNVLDVVHPLWLCLKQTSHRRPEAESWVRERLPWILKQWTKNQGFPFDLAQKSPGLQGTEMWLSIVYLMADLLGASDALGYCPQGVHRPGPALQLPSKS